MFNTPILFIIFNRPDSTQKVFNEIRKQKPKTLFVFADGPRNDNPSDLAKCEDTRKLVKDNLDWDCNINLMFSPSNLGCGKGPAKAITWFFENVSEGIILEDDCLPHSDFFIYAQELLKKYRENEKVMVIGGATYNDLYPCKDSYTFTIYPTLTAWATWKRVWDKYDFNLSFTNHDELSDHFQKYFHSKQESDHWIGMYEWINVDDFSSYWDWQFYMMLFYYEGVAIRPKQNLISNIGVGKDATHTNSIEYSNFKAFRKTHTCIPIVHPKRIVINKEIDSNYFKKINELSFYQKYLESKINKVNKLFKKIIREKTN